MGLHPPVAWGRPSGADVDYDALADFLRALGYPARLELLDALRHPRALADIRLRPQRVKPGENAARSAARQTVQAHLGKLVEADLVRAEEPEADGKARRYVVNATKLYALSESLRRLTVQHAGHGSIGDLTGSVPVPLEPTEQAGPRLVLVHGIYEGRAYPLHGETAKDGQWIIGRKRDCAVALDYDPYVSLENTAVVQGTGGGFAVVDLPSGKNGTWVNWVRMPKESSRPLRSGDFIGVGRSLLSFIAE